MGKRFDRPAFHDDEFEALDEYGLKKGKVARIAHQEKKKNHKKNKLTDSDFESLSRKELLNKAIEMGLPVNARTGRKDLIEAIKNS